MSNETTPASERARKRAAGKILRELSIKRQETYFDLLVSGYSAEQIAIAMKKSPATVRRVVGLALAKRRLDPPEDYARIQVARLTKALRCADESLEEGDVRAIAPFLKVVRGAQSLSRPQCWRGAPYAGCSPGDCLNIASACAHAFPRHRGRGNVGRRRKSCTKMHLSH
jgi:DNA-binding CsgD family transcriptional regulator